MRLIQIPPLCASYSGDWSHDSTAYSSRGAVSKKDPIKLDQERQRLTKLYHAANCQNEGQNCRVESHCFATKRLYHHMIYCQQGNDCLVPGCKKSRKVWRHYRSCSLNGCSTCLLVSFPYKSKGAVTRGSDKDVCNLKDQLPTETSGALPLSHKPLVPPPLPCRSDNDTFTCTVISSISTSLAALRLLPPSSPENNYDETTYTANPPNEEHIDGPAGYLAVRKPMIIGTKVAYNGVEAFLGSNDDSLHQVPRGRNDGIDSLWGISQESSPVGGAVRPPLPPPRIPSMFAE